MQRQNGVLAIASVLLLVMLAVGAGWLWERNRWSARNAYVVCLINTKELTMAMRAYAADNDDSLPAAATWCDDLAPYVAHDQEFVCPVTSAVGASYAMNHGVGNTRIEDLAPEKPWNERHESIVDPVTGEAVDPVSVVVLFDGPEGWNLAGGPEAARYRHNDGANFGFADGHVKWSRSDRVPEWRWPQKLAPDPRDGASDAAHP